MVKKDVIHSPTLASIMMVEKALEKEDFIGKYQLWKKLPKKMMYQTMCLILEYLEKSGKIGINGSKITVIKREKIEPERQEKIIIPDYIR